MRHYVHVGTGNYHAKTARLYEDFGLFTCNRDDRGRRGHALQRAHRRGPAARLPARRWWPPSGCATGCSAEIEKTVEAHRAGEDARIVLKMNSLVDRRCIRALYEASQAGVRVDINVRGICCLRAGVPGVSENIRVVSVVGRFLEHSRVYGFHRGGERRYYIGSADLMPRNLDTRVELLTPGGGRRRCAPSWRTRSSAASPTTPSPGTCSRTARGSAAPAAPARVHRELMERALERAASRLVRR